MPSMTRHNNESVLLSLDLLQNPICGRSFRCGGDPRLDVRCGEPLLDLL